MSQTFLEDIPEFLEIQRNSFLRILDIGLIQAFEKINPIVPTSQCKYGLLFYPKDYVLILPENTITEAFLQGKTYGCKIYVPAVIYNLENLSSSIKIAGRRFKSLKILRFTKTTSLRFSEESFFGNQESTYNTSPNLAIEIKKTKASLLKGGVSRILSWECFLTMLLAIQNLSKKNKVLTLQSKLSSKTFLKTRENKVKNFISKFTCTQVQGLDSILNKASLITQPHLIKNRIINFTDKNSYPRFLKSYKQLLKPTLHYCLKKVVDKNGVLILNLKTAQRTRKKLSQILKKNLIEKQNSVLYSTLPKTIRQKSQLGFVQKNPLWVRGRSNTSLIQEALNRLQLQEASDFFPVNEKRGSKEWLLSFSKQSLINPTYIGTRDSQGKAKLCSYREPMYSKSNNFKKNLDFSLAPLASLAKPVSRKEWVCIGVLPLMTPRGHFIINGSHRIIISQMARAPGLYYQTGEKVQATIVPSKGAWLRLSVKASDNGEIKIWVRITPQRKMPYKIFIETYKHLEISKAVLSKGGSKFLNLAYKTLNSKIKHLDKHYAVGVVSGQINRTLLNSSSYSLGTLGRKRLNERLGINDKKGYLTSKDISLIKDNLLKLLGQKSTDLSADDIDHLENRRVRTCGELLQTEIETGMARLKKAIGKQLDEYSNPDSSLFNTFKNHVIENRNKKNSSSRTISSTAYTTLKRNERSTPSLHFRARLGSKGQSESIAYQSYHTSNYKKPNLVDLQNTVSTLHRTKKIVNFFWLKTINEQNWELYTANPNQTLFFFKQKKSGSFWKKNKNLLFLKKKLSALLTLHNSTAVQTRYKILYQPQKIGITLAQARWGWLFPSKRVAKLETTGCFARTLLDDGKFLNPFEKKEKKKTTITDFIFSDDSFTQHKKGISKIETKTPPNLLSPSKIIGTKAFAGALREFFGSNPLSQYMDQTNPLAEITHKRRLSSLGPGGVDRASAGIAIRGIHPSHYGRICPIETPEGKNAGLVNSMTMWARINTEGFLETPYFQVKGGSLMSHTNNLIPHWNFIPTKTESQGALKIVSSDLKITQSAFLPAIALPTRDGSERSFGREKRDVVHFCGISPMQNISVATSLIPFLEHDDATRALMGSNMQRQAVPLLKAKEPLIRTGLEGKVVGESGHALQAACSGIISTATRTFIAIDSFDIIQKKAVGFGSQKANQSSNYYSNHLSAKQNTTNSNFRLSQNNEHIPANPQEFSRWTSFNSLNTLNKQRWQKKQEFIGNIKQLPFLKDITVLGSSQHSLEKPFNTLLTPKPISSLFYTINYSCKGLFKGWLSTCWPLGTFADVILGLEAQEQPQKKANTRLGKCINISKKNISHKPKTLNCWRTFISAFALTTEHKEKKNYKTLKKRQMLVLPYKKHSTFLKEQANHEKKSKKEKQSRVDLNYQITLKKNSNPKDYSYAPLFSSVLGSDQQSVQVKKLNSKKRKLLEKILLFSNKKIISVNAFHQKEAFKPMQSQAMTAFINLPKHYKQGVIPNTLWRENSKIKRNRKIHDLQQYTRSNQATVCVQRPAVTEGRWVQKGDLIGDCSASKNGVLALGQNIVVAYLPMEGFNFEDAIVVSDRLVHEELYTSIHVQRVEFDMEALVKKHIPRKIKVKKQKSAYKTSNQDWITFNNPHLLQSEKQNLNPLGIINVGSWVGPGDVLVSKVFPVERKIAPSRHLLAAVFQEKKTKILDTDDTSVRVPKGIHGRVINVKIVGAGKTATLPLVQSCLALSYKKKGLVKGPRSSNSTNFSILMETNKSRKASSSTLTLKDLPNSESTQREKPSLLGHNVRKVQHTLLKHRQELNNISAPVETTSPLNSPLEGQQEQAEQRYPFALPFADGNYLNFFRNKEASSLFFYPFFSLDYFARKKRITKALKNAIVFKQNAVFDFETRPFVSQLISTKKAFPFSARLPFFEHFTSFARPATISHFANLISSWPLAKSLGSPSYKTKNDQNQIEKQRKSGISVKPFTEKAILFANLNAKEQATGIACQRLSFKLINSYSSAITNTSPSLVRRVFSQEVINHVTPINKMLLNPLELSFGVNNPFASSTSKNNPYSQSVLNNAFSLEKKNTHLNLKASDSSYEAHPLASDLAPKEKNQENSFDSHSSTQREMQEHNNNLTKKNVQLNSRQLKRKIIFKKSINTQEYKITGVRIYIAERKKLQVGDKMSGRHGNKGIVSTILPREDMPYLPDGTPVDMVLNPLGIPSRMNVGQVFECLLGLAASVCGESIGHTPFDEMYGSEASRSLVYLFLYVSRLRSRADWIFQPNFPGKTLLFDGRTGTPFEQWVTVGRAYMLKLIHMVDEKIHARSIGPRSLVTQQPVKGRARGGGQRLGEMEVWALEGFGAAYTLQEILTIKSDDIKGREEVESSIISATALSAHIPETFRITLFELRCLCLNLELNQNF